VFYEFWPQRSELLVSCILGVKNTIQVALQLAKEQMIGSSMLGQIPPMYWWKLIHMPHFLPAENYFYFQITSKFWSICHVHLSHTHIIWVGLVLKSCHEFHLFFLIFTTTTTEAYLCNLIAIIPTVLLSIKPYIQSSLCNFTSCRDRTCNGM
jgi:hypothetical protein